jgi:predicted transcriptional regulator
MRSADGSNATVETWHIAHAGRSVRPRISFDHLSEEQFSSITEKRIELLRHVAERQGLLNTRQLARCLGRDYGHVQTDVCALEALGLIEQGEKERLSVPYDEIVIHAELTQAA